MNYLYDAPLIWQATAEAGSRSTRRSARRCKGRPTRPAMAPPSACPAHRGPGPTTCNAATAALAIANRSIYNQFLVRATSR